MVISPARARNSLPRRYRSAILAFSYSAITPCTWVSRVACGSPVAKSGASDVVHQRLVGLGFIGDERTTRRAVASVKQLYRDGHRRQYRPWITEPGLCCSSIEGAGPIVFGADGRPRPTLLSVKCTSTPNRASSSRTRTW